MNWNQRIETLVQWGKSIKNRDWKPYYRSIEQSNPWFTRQSIELALDGIHRYLHPEKLWQWAGLYQPKNRHQKTIGIIMAGNIPLVGVHDLICSYLSGHRVIAKLSSQDHILTPLLFKELVTIDPGADNQVTFVSQLNSAGTDAVIATGSDNSSRYFRSYYKHIPGIFRGNRTSVAIIRGDESKSQLEALGHDIFSHFGRGCRNVSKILVPGGYDFKTLINSINAYKSLLNTSKYLNNYQYQKALLRSGQTHFIDTGFSLLFRSNALVSPLSVIYFDFYQDQDHLSSLLSVYPEKIQCTASANSWYKGTYDFGSLQYPELWDYADNLDTMEFLLHL